MNEKAAAPDLARAAVRTVAYAAVSLVIAFGGEASAGETRVAGQNAPATTKATGFFRVEQIGGTWWFVDPQGRPFFSKGVNHVSFDGDYAPTRGHSPYKRAVERTFGGLEPWAEAAAKRLRSWGFNTIGPWSSQEMNRQGMAYTLILDASKATGGEWRTGTMPDVFAPVFAEIVRKRARDLCAPRRDDPLLLGYFTDNELRWTPDQRARRSLLEEFLTKPAETPAKQAAIELIRERFPSVDALNRALGAHLRSLEELPSVISLPLANKAGEELQRAYQRAYAKRYFKTTHDAIREADPNHLILGVRFTGFAPFVVVEVMKEYVDVVSLNDYGSNAPTGTLKRLYRTTGRPVLLSEFSFRAKHSGLPNRKGPGPLMRDQGERAAGFARYATSLAREASVIGFHWFQYSDEPLEGRFDGEDGNVGLVRIDDEPWPELTKRMAQVNAAVDAIHAQAR